MGFENFDESKEDYEKFMGYADRVWQVVPKEVCSFGTGSKRTPDTAQLAKDLKLAGAGIVGDKNCRLRCTSANMLFELPFARQLKEYQGLPMSEIAARLNKESAGKFHNVVLRKFVEEFGLEASIDVACTPECSTEYAKGAHLCKNLVHDVNGESLSTAKVLYGKSQEEQARLAKDTNQQVVDWDNELLDDLDANIKTALVDVETGSTLFNDLEVLLRCKSLVARVYPNVRVIDVRATPYATAIVYEFSTPYKQGREVWQYALEILPLCGKLCVNYYTAESIGGIMRAFEWFVRDDPTISEEYGQVVFDEDVCPFSEQFVQGDGKGDWIIDPNWRERLKDMI